MNRALDIKLATWAGMVLKSERDPLMHNQPTVWSNPGHTAFTTVPWYTSDDAAAVALLTVLTKRGMSFTVTGTEEAYIVRIAGGTGTAYTFHEALTTAIAEAFL